MSGAWVLIGGSTGWRTNEMGDQWDGERMRWGTNEMGDQWCAPVNLRVVLKFGNRVLHTPVSAADLTWHFRLAMPHWNSMARLSWHAKYPKPLQIHECAICFEMNCTWKQMSHRVMFDYRLWSEIKLIDENVLGIPALFARCSKRSHSNCTCLHKKVRREICQNSRH